MNDLYKEIKTLVEKDTYNFLKDKETYKQIINNYLRLISNHDLNEWHLKLNLLLLPLCDDYEFKKVKEKCIEIEKLIKDINLKAFMFMTFANIHRNRFENIAAKSYYEQSLTILKEIGKEKESLLVELNYAILLVRMDNIFEAYKILTALIEKGFIKEDNSNLMVAYSWLGVIEGKFKNYCKSIEYELLCKAIAIEENDMYAYAVLQNSLGINYYYLEQYELALQSYNEAIELATKQSNFDLLADVLHNVGNVYKKHGGLKKAEEYYLKALNLKGTEPNLNNLAASYAELGNLYLDMQRFEEAKTLLYKALHIRKEYKLSKTIVKSHLDYANYFVLTKEFDIARSIIERVIRNFDELDYNNLEKAYGMFETISINQEDFESALKYAKQKKEYREKFNQQESQQSIEDLKINFDLDIIKDNVQKKINLEKQKIALKRGIEAKEQVEEPIIEIKNNLKCIEKSFHKQNIYYIYEQNFAKMYAAIKKIEETLNTFENNKEIIFKKYLETEEMVEFIEQPSLENSFN
ncbi:MAG: tetratricopeptide repeat protein [Candidatus Cloacimonadales bacterium]